MTLRLRASSARTERSIRTAWRSSRWSRSASCRSVSASARLTPARAVAIGNSNSLEYWEYKKGELTQSYRSPEPFTHDISRVVISGSADKASIFIAMGSQIKGVTKRGKEFFKLDTSHTETITQLHVAGTNLWSAGAYTLTCYASADNAIVDKYFFVCDDKINAMLVQQLTLGDSSQLENCVILACNDSSIKLISD